MKKILVVGSTCAVIVLVSVHAYGYVKIGGYKGYDKSEITASSKRLETLKGLSGTSYLCDFTNGLKPPYDPSSLPPELQVAFLSGPVTSKTVLESLHTEAEKVDIPTPVPIVSALPPTKSKLTQVNRDQKTVDALVNATKVSDEIRYCDGVEFALGSLVGYRSLADGSTPLFPGMLDLYKEDINRYRTQIDDLTQSVPSSLKSEHDLLKSFADKAEVTLSSSSTDRKLLADTVNSDISQLQVFLDSVTAKTQQSRLDIEATLTEAQQL